MATTFTNQATLTYNGTQVLSNIAVGRLESTLSVTKNAVGTTYAAGEVITYVIPIVNSGTAPAADLTLTDDLGAYPFGTGTVQPLSYIDGSVQYYVNGVLQPAPAVTTTDGLEITGISVPAKGDAAIVYSAQVNAYAPLDVGAQITNTVNISGSAKTTLQGQDVLSVTEAPLLTLDKNVSPVPVTEDDLLTYTIRLSNSGNTAVTDADNAVISDTFDPLLSNITVELDGAPLSAADYTYDAEGGDFATNAGVITVPAATYTQDPDTGAWTTVPGTATLTVSGSVTGG